MLKRKPILYTLLAATIVAAVWPGVDDASAVVEPSAAVRPVKVAVAAPGASEPKPADLALYKLERASMVVTTQNPFATTSWVVAPPPPPPPAAAAPPPPQTAPAMPFVYAGRLQGTGGRWTYYLTRGDQSFAVSRGETFDTSYRLDSVDDSKMVIEYLPLSVKQTLSLMGES
ncbi:hypothetical protein O0880_10665 [Janthinobacterium sp. SUN118]|uniref:hypothetical protein n=1 Tax=Janthinobacterium sp. SUN118 TaxID=3004100 RepID=UPI0025B10FD0|nr:hypothetical protein [Janthinobacterium sp. SUN118]MDN2709875.1 hypothetical protein [Janthinobacterium sp. SUN118]